MTEEEQMCGTSQELCDKVTSLGAEWNLIQISLVDLVLQEVFKRKELGVYVEVTELYHRGRGGGMLWGNLIPKPIPKMQAKFYGDHIYPLGTSWRPLSYTLEINGYESLGNKRETWPIYLQGAQERIKELVANEYTITQFDAVIIPLTDSKLIDATKKLVGLLKK